MTLTSGRANACRIAYRLVLLPDHPVSSSDQTFPSVPLVLFHTEVFKGKQSSGLVEKSKYQPLPMLRRKRADTDIYEPVPYTDTDTSVLRYEALGNIHVRHDLYAACHWGLVSLR